MTKGALTFTSLVAAIPGGILTYLTVMAFVNFTDRMATMLQVFTGVTLLVSVLMALSPFAILLFVRTPVAEGAGGVAPAGSGATGAVAAAAAPAAIAAGAAVGDDEDLGELADADVDSADAFSDDDGLDQFADEDESADSTGEFSLEDDDEFEFEDDDSK